MKIQTVNISFEDMWHSFNWCQWYVTYPHYAAIIPNLSVCFFLCFFSVLFFLWIFLVFKANIEFYITRLNSGNPGPGFNLYIKDFESRVWFRPYSWFKVQKTTKLHKKRINCTRKEWNSKIRKCLNRSKSR